MEDGDNSQIQGIKTLQKLFKKKEVFKNYETDHLKITEITPWIYSVPQSQHVICKSEYLMYFDIKNSL